jgi:hypothetical protein
VFDVARLLALAYALALAGRRRAWLELGVLGFAAYVLGLEIASGFTVRNEGPQEPMMALVLALIGPSAIPRGRLPAVPLALAVVARPALVDAVVAGALAVSAKRLGDRARRIPAAFSDEVMRLDRLATAMVLVAVFEGIAVGVRVLPDVLLRD